MKNIRAAAALVSIGFGLASTDVNAETRDTGQVRRAASVPTTDWGHSSQQQTAPSGGVSVSNTSAGNRR